VLSEATADTVLHRAWSDLVRLTRHSQRPRSARAKAPAA
jgi:hypothetical protein